MESWRLTRAEQTRSGLNETFGSLTLIQIIALINEFYLTASRGLVGKWRQDVRDRLVCLYVVHFSIRSFDQCCNVQRISSGNNGPCFLHLVVLGRQLRSELDPRSLL